MCFRVNIVIHFVTFSSLTLFSCVVTELYCKDVDSLELPCGKVVSAVP